MLDTLEPTPAARRRSPDGQHPPLGGARRARARTPEKFLPVRFDVAPGDASSFVRVVDLGCA